MVYVCIVFWVVCSVQAFNVYSGVGRAEAGFVYGSCMCVCGASYLNLTCT